MSVSSFSSEPSFADVCLSAIETLSSADDSVTVYTAGSVEAKVTDSPALPGTVVTAVILTVTVTEEFDFVTVDAVVPDVEGCFVVDGAFVVFARAVVP